MAWHPPLGRSAQRERTPPVCAYVCVCACLSAFVYARACVCAGWHAHYTVQVIPYIPYIAPKTHPCLAMRVDHEVLKAAATRYTESECRHIAPKTHHCPARRVHHHIVRAPVVVA